MLNQAKYLIIFLCVLCFLIGSVINLAQAQEPTRLTTAQQTNEEAQLNQGQLEQILAPIALYPDTLLSHILVASTYPLEIVQAERWRQVNKDLTEQQTLDAAESKDWAPSVKALTPFTDLLTTLSTDLDWLQSLGSAFLFDEERVLASVQALRQKAYAQGNLTNNEYIDVKQDAEEIVIQSVKREVVYIPFYDTRTVYGNWWWNDHPPYYWHSPSHYIWSAGVYWSAKFLIRPSFYFSGFLWHDRHIFANYGYRTHKNNRHWSNSHYSKQRVRVTERPRWTHSQHHRRGVQYKQNGKRIIRNSENPNRYISNNSAHSAKKKQQIDKQRILNVDNYRHKNNGSHYKEVKRKLVTHNNPANYSKRRVDKNTSAKRNIVSQVPKHKESRQTKSNSWRQHTVNKTHQIRSSNHNAPAFQQRKSTNRKPSNYQAKPRSSSAQRTNKARPVKSIQSSRSKEHR
ncbi:DUF3300 domain-containing protein [Paraglaciecola aquimarina]|uniref:DUF3300 domain-containing protein n=1 Tax=Paraglaciecola aquimarina TaxID=1235557 RepID=A0ABU3SS96_9ALTE|nr:DUF3300 domain-containing protein [Paraglaciecola aquimarina]MDU0352894.1 DUF3300 domain-containing protein [Paraglaciecola aquimarina]